MFSRFASSLSLMADVLYVLVKWQPGYVGSWVSSVSCGGILGDSSAGTRMKCSFWKVVL